MPLGSNILAGSFKDQLFACASHTLDTYSKMMRRSSLTAAVALRQLGQRSAQAQAAQAATSLKAVDLASSDLAFAAPPTLLHRQVNKAPMAASVACSSTRNPANPALLAAQAKDASLLTKVADDFLSTISGNWQLELTNVKYAQALPAGKPFALDVDYLASLSLARGASFSY
jgi:hypothetical protein